MKKYIKAYYTEYLAYSLYRLNFKIDVFSRNGIYKKTIFNNSELLEVILHGDFLSNIEVLSENELETVFIAELLEPIKSMSLKNQTVFIAHYLFRVPSSSLVIYYSNSSRICKKCLNSFNELLYSTKNIQLSFFDAV